MTLPKKVLAALLPLGLGVTLVALAQTTNSSAPEGTTIVEKTQAGSTVGQPGQANRDLNTPQNVGNSAPVQVAQTTTPQDQPPATTPSPAPSPADTQSSSSTQSGSSMDTSSSQSNTSAPPATTTEKSESSTYGTPATSSASASASTDDANAKKLPKTASDLPLAALAGALALGAGLGLRALRR